MASITRACSGASESPCGGGTFSTIQFSSSATPSLGLDATEGKSIYRSYNAMVGSGTIIMVDREGKLAWYKIDPTERDKVRKRLGPRVAVGTEKEGGHVALSSFHVEDSPRKAGPVHRRSCMGGG